MKLSPEERAERRASFRKMNLPQKLEYIFSYYRLPLALGLLAVLVLGNVLWRLATKKEDLLYVAYLNVTVGENLDRALGPEFVTYLGGEQKKSEVTVYRNLYLSLDPSTENHQYAYATRMKLLASVEAEKLDVVLMNQESYDILSQDGYLLELTGLLAGDGDLSARAGPYLRSNTVVLEDNSIEVALDEAETYEAVTRQAVNALEVSGLPLFQGAGFSSPVYLGVIGNSPRLDAAGRYISYLLAAGAA